MQKMMYEQKLIRVLIVRVYIINFCVFQEEEKSRNEEMQRMRFEQKLQNAENAVIII